ncbi:hypothetical protein BSBH6_03500 [Bacillus subtilis]|nr:hypothetical protein BSBH6_03500 [Bacillus subtilis]RPK22239.1 hypothetical protein BH5_03504 [Bacillus subtilis]
MGSEPSFHRSSFLLLRQFCHDVSGKIRGGFNMRCAPDERYGFFHLIEMLSAFLACLKMFL